MPLLTQVLKLLALSLAVLFLLGVVVTAVPIFFGDSKVKTLFGESHDALAGEVAPRNGDTTDAARPTTAEVEPERARLFMHASKAGPMPVPEPQAAPAPVDAGETGQRERVFFPASKSPGGTLFNDDSAKQATP